MRKAQSSSTIYPNHIDITKQEFSIRIIPNSDKENANPNFILPSTNEINSSLSEMHWNRSENNLNNQLENNNHNFSLDFQNMRKLSLESWDDDSHHLLKNKILAQNGFTFGAKISDGISDMNSNENLKRYSLMTMDTFTSEIESFSEISRESQINNQQDINNRILRDVTCKYTKLKRKSEINVKSLKKRRLRNRKKSSKNKRIGVLRM